jgi:hypothetical protein
VWITYQRLSGARTASVTIVSYAAPGVMSWITRVKM